MIEGEPWIYHSHLSFYLNCGLLDPLECARDWDEVKYFSERCKKIKSNKIVISKALSD